MKSEMTSSLSLEGLTVKCSNCARDVDIARMGDHECQSTAPFQATGEATPPPDHEIEFQSRSSFNDPLPSPGRRQEHDYLPWSSQQQGNSFDPSGKPTRLGPLPRIDPFAANKPFLRPDVLTPNSAKSIPHTPTSATTSKQPPASPLHPQPRPYMAASQSSFIPYSITAAASSPGPEQQRHPLAGSGRAASDAYVDQDNELHAPPSMSCDIQNPNGPVFMRSSGFPTDIIPPLSPHPGLNRSSSDEESKHRRETSIDSKSVHARNPYHSGRFSGLSIRDTTRKGDLATVPASPAALNEFSPANIISDAEQPQMATGRSRGYSSKYGPPSPTSHYAASHAPSESIYSTQFRLDEEFSVANFARDIGLMDASDEMYIDDEELDMTIGDLEAHQTVIYAEPTRMHHSTNSESTQGSRASGFNAGSVSTSATSIGRSDSQEFKKTIATVKGGSCYDGMDSPTDPFFMHGRLSNPDYNGGHKIDSVVQQVSGHAPSAPKLQDAPAKPSHRTQKSSISSVASKIKASRRCSAGHCDKGSPIITQFPLPPSSVGVPNDGMAGGRRPSKAESISSLRGNGTLGFTVDASSELEQATKKLRGSHSDSITTVPRNGGLPTPSPSVEKLSACHEVSETQEAESSPQPETKVEQEVKRGDQNEPRSEPSHVKTEVVAPPAPSPAPTSPTSPSKPRVRNRCRGCSEVIVGKSVSSADGRLTGRWHRKCFRCNKCQEPFATGDFYVHEDRPYCSQHYHELNGSLCAACNSGIEGTYLETEGIQEEENSWGPGGRPQPSKSQSMDSIHPSATAQEQKKRGKKYHPECFKCATCQIVLRGDYFEWNGLAYCERDSRTAAGITPYAYPAPPPFPRANTWNDSAPNPGTGPQTTHHGFPHQPYQPPPMHQHPPMGLAPLDPRRPMTPNFPPRDFCPPNPGFRSPGPHGPHGPLGHPGAMRPRGPPPPRPPRPGYTPAVPYPPATPTRLPPQRGLPPGSDFDCHEEIGGDFGPFMPGRVPYGRGPFQAGTGALPMPIGAAGPGGSPHPPSRRFPERRTTKLSFI